MTSSRPADNKPREPVVPLQSSLASLFDNNKDPSGSGFGMGGMLGIRAGIPKMPSFKVCVSSMDLFVSTNSHTMIMP